MGGLSIWSARFCTFAKDFALVEGCAMLMIGTKGEENAISSFQTIGCACRRAASRGLRGRRRADYRPPVRPGPSQPQMCPMIYAPVCATRGSSRKTFGNSCQASGRLSRHRKRPMRIEAGSGMGRCGRNASAASGQQARQAGHGRLHAGIYARLRKTR